MLYLAYITEDKNMKAIMNIEETAEYLGFSTKKIYRLVEENKIPASRIGRQYRFMKDIIDTWLRENTVYEGPGWNKRLNIVLKNMRKNADTTENDISEEIKKVRKEHRDKTKNSH